MSKLKSDFSIKSYGIYDCWNEKSKALPQIKRFTTDVPAHLNIEFGFILNAKKAKGKKLNFTIYHPDIPYDMAKLCHHLSAKYMFATMIGIFT